MYVLFTQNSSLRVLDKAVTNLQVEYGIPKCYSKMVLWGLPGLIFLVPPFTCIVVWTSRRVHPVPISIGVIGLVLISWHLGFIGCGTD
jgi:hypothetical protein